MTIALVVVRATDESAILATLVDDLPKENNRDAPRSRSASSDEVSALIKRCVSKSWGTKSELTPSFLAVTDKACE